MSCSSIPRIWITYAWVDDEEGDFSYLVQELGDFGIEATYDKVAIIPGRDLWEQIGDKITEGEIDGWGYLITPHSLESEACREELAYALDRALHSKGRDFPLIGLLHGVRIRDVPPSLRVRLCVSLANPNWKEEVKAGLEGRPPKISTEPQMQYVWKLHEGYLGNSTLTAIEVRPRFGEVFYWRFVVPKDSSISQWGHGPSGGASLSMVKTQVVDGGSGKLNDVEITWFGAGDRLSPGKSAYIVFNGPLPSFIGFGYVSKPFGEPGPLEIFRLK